MDETLRRCQKCNAEVWWDISDDEVICLDCKSDVIHTPSHYHKGGIDVIEFCKGKLSPERRAGFYQMNALKYITRYQDKNGVEDLQKAQFYLDKLIELESADKQKCYREGSE